jgi:hypothetical protein
VHSYGVSSVIERLSVSDSSDSKISRTALAEAALASPGRLPGPRLRWLLAGSSDLAIDDRRRPRAQLALPINCNLGTS